MTNEPQKRQGAAEELIPEFYQHVEIDQQQIVVNNFTFIDSSVTITNGTVTPPQDARLIHFLNSQKASWIFGIGLIALLIGFLVAGPEHLAPYKLMILGHLTGLCSGFLCFFLSGNLGLEIQSLKNDLGKLTVRAVGGIAVYALVVYVWISPTIGVMHAINAEKPPAAIEQQQQSEPKQIEHQQKMPQADNQ